VTGIVTEERGPSGLQVPGLRVLVVTVSTRAASGEYDDRSGPAVVDALSLWGITDVERTVVADDEVALVALLREAVDSGFDAVLTTGGTGLSPDDRTPEATRQVVDREVSGVAEAIRAAGVAAGIATAALSRGVAGASGTTVIVNLPGSVGGARDGVAVVGPLLEHVRSQLGGGDH
jgi:molybdenum cofactor synthesis domain-containing protein